LFSIRLNDTDYFIGEFEEEKGVSVLVDRISSEYAGNDF
jgi:hypothetical protein